MAAASASSWEVVVGASACKLVDFTLPGHGAAWNRAEKWRERISIRKTLLVDMYILHGIFEDEAAAYTTLLQFSEFYKTTGGHVPV